MILNVQIEADNVEQIASMLFKIKTDLQKLDFTDSIPKAPLAYNAKFESSIMGKYQINLIK